MVRSGQRAGNLYVAAAAVLLAACSSVPIPVQDPEGQLAAAEAQLAGGDPEACLASLAAHGREAFPSRLRDRYEVTEASAHFALGETWDAFEITEKFPDRHPHSELRPAIVELDWQIGKTMSTSGNGFWIFWSDRRGARTVLEHLITRHPDSPRLADALKVLGDLAYEDGSYPLAQERFRELMRRRPESEWFVYASFRFAMSIYEGLKGPDYDLDQMQHASRELVDFLATNPENPEFKATASAALQTLREWQAERHHQIAEFYHTVGNPIGRRLHLEIAAGEQFSSTVAHDRAAAELRTLAPADAPAGAEARR
jgi:outer membrane protein assembly factor BamD (BamD/ComL family)